MGSFGKNYLWAAENLSSISSFSVSACQEFSVSTFPVFLCCFLFLFSAFGVSYLFCISAFHISALLGGFPWPVKWAAYFTGRGP
jgi:hypothetical protein